MRYGIFSDVHANLEALTAVLRGLEAERPDALVCLGDVVGYGANPNECVDLIRRSAKVCILGNHDAAVAGRMDYSYYYDAARTALDRHKAILSEDNLRWLRTLPYEHREDGISFCHGSPVNHEEFEYIFSLEQAARLLPVWDDLADVTFIGHSHLCTAFALTPETVHAVVAQRFLLRPRHKYVISDGSVGQPRDYDARASFTIFDTSDKTFEFKRVEYDVETAARKILEADLEPSFGHRLFAGV